MVTVLVTGATAPLGTRLVRRLQETPSVAGVVVVDEIPADLGRLATGSVTLVHLGPPKATAALLAAAPAALVGFVLRSTTAVYGAWPDNPVPLTENAPVRPNPGFAFAAEHAEAERLLAEWSGGRPEVATTVLRLAPVVATASETWESRALARPSRLRRGEDLAPLQFLDAEDAAAAFVHVVTESLQGTFNVAPEGFLSGAQARLMAGPGLSAPLADPVAALAERVVRRVTGSAPASALPYLVHPWVVASDRLRTTGWRPAHSNAEALVAARSGSWWRELSPQQRQEVALGAAGAGSLLSLAGVLARLSARRRRRQPG